MGTFPEDLAVNCAEFHAKENVGLYEEKYPAVKRKTHILSSDAHFLWDIRDKDAFFTLDDEPYSSKKVRHELFKILKGERK